MIDIKVIVATHKKYRIPEDNIYLPLHVGREGKEDLGYRGDNEGNNISLKNDSYCEITALYWVWKNLNCDYIGLCHYRRYFTDKNIIRAYGNPVMEDSSGQISADTMIYYVDDDLFFCHGNVHLKQKNRNLIFYLSI